MNPDTIGSLNRLPLFVLIRVMLHIAEMPHCFYRILEDNQKNIFL